MENCIFCKIVKGVIPASVAYSDDRVMAFLDIQPINPGHTLIIPKAHDALLSELDEETGAHMFVVAMRVAAALRRSGLRCEGINLVLSDGEVAFQEIPHVHLHVIPRFRGDGFRIKFGRDYGSRPNNKELNEVASKIREVMH